MPMNNFIKRLTTKPGRYVITSFPLLARGVMYAVEVDEKGNVHQLTPQGVRDGILSAVGWIGNEIVLDPRTVDDETVAIVARKPVAEVEAWPDDKRALAVMPLVGWDELPEGTKLYKEAV